MKKVGIIGWRGMVGSVLIERMLEEGDFKKIDAHFYSTSQPGELGPKLYDKEYKLKDANDEKALSEMDIIISCQGGDYTKDIRPKLENIEWSGYWIDAASAKRMDDDSIIILDPVNRDFIDHSIDKGVKNFIGGNCTVSLMLMGIGSLFKEGLIEWMTSMTYQAASGGGARHMKELLAQMGVIGSNYAEISSKSILDIDKKMSDILHGNELNSENFGVPLALNLIPWIDSAVDNGQTREEWKAMSETNKILNSKSPIPIDGTCVRIGALRSHSQALTIKLNKTTSIETIEQLLKSNSEWTEFVENSPEVTRDKLNPRYVSGTLKTTVGRVRKMNLGDDYINIFTSGDQLLWGAAEPLRRMMNILL